MQFTAAVHLAALFLLLNMASCSSLPNVRDRIEWPDDRRPPTIVRAERHLSPLESQATVARLGQHADILEKHLLREEMVTGQPLVAGNAVRLFADGPSAYEAMTSAIQNATDHINFETYIFEDDQVGQRFAELLIQKADQGVQVNLMYDAVGAIGTSPEFFERLRRHGVLTLEFNPIKTLDLRRLNQRNHRKILVVDGLVAFIGGVNISRVYSKSPFAKSRGRERGGLENNWRDSHIQIEGPSVTDFQRFFMEDWNQGKGADLPMRRYFPVPQERGKELIRAISSTPRNHSYAVYEVLVSALSHAERYIHLTQAYFVPDSEILAALTTAALRGVEVTLILPSFSDSGPVFHAGRSHYRSLLRAGVKIYERKGAFLHAKTVVIDGVWSTVGSANLDWRSFMHNDEVNAVILGGDFAGQLEVVFRKDLELSEQILPEEWEQRALSTRFKEWAARWIEYLL
jgi:cardiolipin synthase